VESQANQARMEVTALDLIRRVARDHMEDTALVLILSRLREATEATAVDQVQGSQVRDLVMVVTAVEDQAVERCVSFFVLVD